MVSLPENSRGKKELIQNIFNGIGSPEFKCSICFDSFLNFQNTSFKEPALQIFYFKGYACQCNNLYCLKCLNSLVSHEQHTKCTTCKKYGEFVNVPKVLLNIIQDYKVTCICKEEIKMIDFCRHIETVCKSVYVKCKQCGVNILRNKLLKHSMEKCPRWLLNVLPVMEWLNFKKHIQKYVLRNI